MRKLVLIILFIGMADHFCSAQRASILIFSKTKAYRHESIADGKVALQKLCSEMGFSMDTTESSDVFTYDNLKKYYALVFLSTTGDLFNEDQQEALQRYIRSGGGYVGIHGASDAEYDWPWYGKLVGAYFKNHPPIQPALMTLAKSFGKSKLQERWERIDEWHNYKDISVSIEVIYYLEESSYQGGENAGKHPIVWFQKFDGGRSFYMGIGHTRESYREKFFLDLLREGILFAVGDR